MRLSARGVFLRNCSAFRGAERSRGRRGGAGGVCGHPEGVKGPKGVAGWSLLSGQRELVGSSFVGRLTLPVVLLRSPVLNPSSVHAFPFPSISYIRNPYSNTSQVPQIPLEHPVYPCPYSRWLLCRLMVTRW